MSSKQDEPTIPVSQAIRMIEEVLPNSLVQRSWSLGPQRMCQELNRMIYHLRCIEQDASLGKNSSSNGDNKQ